ncbi:MAG TPA: hypothetical protein ENN03_03595 [bacterium]|nr:hypothetical protein [bacterium]
MLNAHQGKKPMKLYIRKKLMNTAQRLEKTATLFRGAADRIAPEKRITLLDLERDSWRSVRPCFVLSTGRSGTLLLNKLLELSPDAYPVHEPVPELIRPSKRAYEEIDRHSEIFLEVLKGAREELLFRAARNDKIYIETNNRITFFAPVIPGAFPNAVYIHLVRHPGDFVRSGLRRNWYTESHPHDVGRIVPVRKDLLKKWAGFTQLEKIAWLWNETHHFIEAFKKTVDPSSVLFVKAEDLFRDTMTTRRIYKFVHISGYYEPTVKKILRRRFNAQRKGRAAPYREWDEKEKTALKNMALLAEKYDYSI